MDTGKLPDIEAKSSSNELQRTTSIVSDSKGNTIITREDGETFTISEQAECALVWKFDIRILPLLALMYLFNALDKSNLGNAKTSYVKPTSEIELVEPEHQLTVLPST